MNSSKLSKKSFAVYGLGLTGLSVINHFKKNSIKNFCVWDDDKSRRLKFQKYLSKDNFSKKLNKVDHIVISPGINLKKTKFSNQLQKNKKKNHHRSRSFLSTKHYRKNNSGNRNKWKIYHM